MLVSVEPTSLRYNNPEEQYQHIRLTLFVCPCNSTKTVEQIWMNFDMDIMPVGSTLKFYFLISCSH
jgi:hypothetical protein